jgi:hypothetical protein
MWKVDFWVSLGANLYQVLVGAGICGGWIGVLPNTLKYI